MERFEGGTDLFVFYRYLAILLTTKKNPAPTGEEEGLMMPTARE